MAEEREVLKIAQKFITNRQGRDHVLYAGLLDAAHREGLKRITTKLLEMPTEANGNTAVCWAEVETDWGVFSGIGDANTQNVGRMIAMHTIRMAETRAKARALRDAINVGMTSVEELGEDDTAQPDAPRQPAPQRPASQPAQPTPIRSAATDTVDDATWQRMIDACKALADRYGVRAELPTRPCTTQEATAWLRRAEATRKQHSALAAKVSKA